MRKQGVCGHHFNEKDNANELQLSDIRKWLLHFRTLDYSKTKHRKELINIFIYRIVLYDDKMKVLFHLKGGQKEDLLLTMIFSDYPDGNSGEDISEDEKSAKERETANAISLSGCSYTPSPGEHKRNQCELVKMNHWKYCYCSGMV